MRLTKQTPKAETVPALCLTDGHIIEAADIYRLYFHGPAYQVMERAWWDGHRIVGLMAKGLPANHMPSELPTLMAPRLIELCFQTAGVWEMGAQGRMGLPQHIDRVSSFYYRLRIGRHSLIRRGHFDRFAATSMRRLWMRKETATCNSAGTAR